MGTSARAIALTGSDQAVRADATIYRGFSIRETSGSAAAVVRLFDNASAASGTVLDEISLASGESVREWYEGGIWAVNGIYVDVVSGAVAGSVRVG
jgi:hypothetical protein